VKCQICAVPLDPTMRAHVCPACGWEPSPGPQYRFLQLPVYEKLYGGAAGGGKTDALVMGLLDLVHEPTYNGIIFRRTFPELAGQVIPKSMQWYRSAGGIYNESKHFWRFPSGARIHFGHLQHESDVHRYQGWEFQRAAFDELTSFTRYMWSYIKTRLRSSVGLPCEAWGATNPGGEGHEWVLEHWAPWLRVDDTDYDGPRAAPGQVMWYVPSVDAHGNVTTKWVPKGTPGALSRVFVPAKLTDNPHLLKNDPTYLTRLDDQDRLTREQLKNGNWLAKPQKGDFFQKHWFDIVDAVPIGRLTEVRWWDRAATVDEPGKKPDWTAGVRMARDMATGLIYIIDVIRFQEKPTEVEEFIIRTAKADGKRVLVRGALDPGSAGVFEASSYTRALAGYDVEFIRETGDKCDRARPVASQVKAGNVKLLRGPWNRQFLDEAEGFPFGKKDQIDGTSGAFSVLHSDDIVARLRLKNAMAAMRSAG
jgi:predicted phage terminase large subunit-like protein